MKLVQVALANAAYPIYIGSGALGNRSLWQRHLGTGAVLVVTNEVVAPLYLETLRRGVGQRSIETVVLPDGEAHKSMLTWKHLIARLTAINATRDATVIALGGGVVGDLAGFAAATYMRGIRFIQAPTTLLAQVDAAIGGKTAINLRAGKNLVGAFHQPAAVISDLDALTTLPEREYHAGLAEVLKYGAIRDAGFFHWLSGQRSGIKARLTPLMAEMVERSSAHKAAVVAADELESGERALLNFGHTFGHALETAGRYQRHLHGEAVAIGMVLAARLSERIGLCPAGAADAISDLLADWQLPTRPPSGSQPQQLLELMQLDKKTRHDGLRLILLKAIGEATIEKGVSGDDILEILQEVSA
ncbi:MAG: 3-dehydroquinate synthase [Wenzhouxiangellaceae bacterium]